jgi:hypothetical protein
MGVNKISRYLKFQIAKLAFTAFILTSIVPTVQPQSNSTVAPPRLIPGGEQVIYAPIVGLEDFTTWQVVIVNRSTELLSPTITIYSSEGNPFPVYRSSRESDHSTENPDAQNQRGSVYLTSYHRRINENSGADDAAHDDHRRVEQAEAAG